MRLRASMQKLSGKLRIIGGRWRGRRLLFAAMPGVRPTPDRVRETVFNWLLPHLHDAHCLDLFTGSGALGFEALSRGAAHVVMVDNAAEVMQQLKGNADMLEIPVLDYLTAAEAGNDKVSIQAEHTGPSLSLLRHDLSKPIEKPAEPFDIVFLDPPYRQDWLKPTIEWLHHRGFLKPDALVYMETEAELEPLPVPAHWTVLRSKKAGQVGYHLLAVNHEMGR